jgi:biopolymer transport protein ExbD
MPIRYHCPHCGQHLSIASRLAGHQTKCPACLTAHVVPETDEHGSAAPKRRSKPEAGPVLHTETKPQERTAEKQTPARHVTVKAAPRQPVERQTPERPTEKREAAERAIPERKHLVPAVVEHPQGPSIPISYEIDPLEDDDDEEALVIGKIERKSDELDLIPMVDCVFLLLIFYMITASYALQKTIEMGKPAAEKKGAMSSVQTIDETAQSSVVVQIDARNRISVDDVPLDSVAGLPDRLRAKMNGEQKNELVIEADPKALHETIVAVVDAAHELQFQHVRMALNTGDND